LPVAVQSGRFVQQAEVGFTVPRRVVKHEFADVFPSQHCTLHLTQICSLANVLDDKHPQVIADFLDLWDRHWLHDWPLWPLE
jgi:hypothetical protein